MVMKELILPVSTLDLCVVVMKELIFNSSLMWGGGSGGLKRTDYNSFYFGLVWWS